MNDFDNYMLSRNIKFLVTVQKVKNNIYGYKLQVPSKFKDNSEEIQEMKGLFEVYRIEFID